MNEDLTTRLSRQLHAQADGWHGAPLTLEGVQGTARTIRNRRRAVAGSALAAAVLAIAIPVGVTFGGGPDTSPSPANPSPTRLVDGEDPIPRSPLGVPFIEGRTLVLTSGEKVELPRRDYLGGAVLGSTVVALGSDEGNLSLDVLGADLEVTETIPLDTGFAVDADGSAIAYVRADDGQLVVDNGAGQITELGVHDGISEVVSVVGTTVWFNLGRGGFGVAQDGGPAVQRPEAEAVTDVAPDGRVSVVTSIDLLAGGACSAVVDGATTVHDSCDYTYGRFSPDGRHLSAHPSYRSGIGDTFVAILDGKGDEVARWDAPRGDFVRSSTWEDAEHLLVTTYAYDEGWSVVRLGVDGSRDVVLGPSAGTDVSPAYVVLGGAG